MAENTW